MEEYFLLAVLGEAVWLSLLTRDTLLPLFFSICWNSVRSLKIF